MTNLLTILDLTGLGSNFLETVLKPCIITIAFEHSSISYSHDSSLILFLITVVSQLHRMVIFFELLILFTARNCLCHMLYKLLDATTTPMMFFHIKIGKETTNGYPLARVEEQNGAVKLPCTDDELRFLERLHCIITEMGNVLGLVRVLQAGCSRHVHHTSRFLYKPITIKSYEEHAQKLGSINGMITAGKIMDMAIENKQHAEEHVKCFSSLLTAFSKEFQSIDNLPFRDFYLIIPHLVINLIDSKFNCKDNILRRGRDMGNQITTDDGFVMGVAFVLKVTGQEKSFDGLCWFANASKHLEEQLLSLEESSRYTEQRTGSSGLTRLKLWGQTASPVSTEDQKRIDKLKSYQKELELVRCGLEVARTIMSCN